MAKKIVPKSGSAPKKVVSGGYRPKVSIHLKPQKKK